MAYARAQVAAMTSFDPLVRRGVPDSVNQMRIATRRLRSMLRSFGGVLRRDQTEALEAELRPLVGGPIVARMFRYDTDPAHNPQPPPRGSSSRSPD